MDYRSALAQTGARVAFVLTVQLEVPNPVLLRVLPRQRRARTMPKLGLRLRAKLPLERRGDVLGLLPPKRQGGVRGNISKYNLDTVRTENWLPLGRFRHDAIID